MSATKIKYMVLIGGVLTDVESVVAMGMPSSKNKNVRSSSAKKPTPRMDDGLRFIIVERGAEQFAFVRAGTSFDLAMPNKRVFPEQDFLLIAQKMMHTGQGSGMIGAVTILAEYCPHLNFVPDKLLDVVINPLNPNRSFGESLAGMCWKYDLGDYSALLHSGSGYLDPKDIAHLVEPSSFRHLVKRWFAFKSEDDAVLVKVARQADSRIFPFA